MPVVIQHKISKELFRAKSGKTSWQKPAHAKNAFANSTSSYYLDRYYLNEYEHNLKNKWDSLKFDDQDVWEIVELNANTEKLHGDSLSLLKEVFERERSISWGLADRIEKHLIACGVEINYED